MRAYFVYLILLWCKAISRLFYIHEIEWVEDPPEGLWQDLRIGAILNHTSLYEWLYAGAFPNEILWRVAKDSVLPVADTTLKRPIVGFFFRLVARRVIPVSRQRDHTWEALVRSLDRHSLVVILPEGRMKRANGLDKHGKPMSVRGGIADLVELVPEGKMLLVYSAGLHHVQVPGQRVPRLFKRLRVRLEAVEISAYRDGIQDEASASSSSFKRAIIEDLNGRRDRHCPQQPA